MFAGPVGEYGHGWPRPQRPLGGSRSAKSPTPAAHRQRRPPPRTTPRRTHPLIDSQAIGLNDIDDHRNWQLDVSPGPDFGQHQYCRKQGEVTVEAIDVAALRVSIETWDTCAIDGNPPSRHRRQVWRFILCSCSALLSEPRRSGPRLQAVRQESRPRSGAPTRADLLRPPNRCRRQVSATSRSSR